MNTIQPTLFDLTGSVFTSPIEARREVQAPKAPMFCPLVNIALELALLPGKGEVVSVKSGDKYAVIAPHIDDKYVFIVQMKNNGIVGTKRALRANGFSLNAILDEKFKKPDAEVKTWREKAWEYCHFLYDSKKHCLDEYKKTIEGSAGK